VRPRPRRPTRSVTLTPMERRFLALLAERQVETQLPRDLFVVPSVLLCSEPTAAQCHRRLVAEYLRERWGGFTIVHL